MVVERFIQGKRRSTFSELTKEEIEILRQEIDSIEAEQKMQSLTYFRGVV